MNLDTLALLFIAALTAFTAWTNLRTARIATETKAIALKTEIASNSMKDALVAATATASKAEGRDEMRAENQTARAETIAATAAGVAAVAEANRTHEASSAAIEKGAQAAVEPIAEKAVAAGAKEAVSELSREALKKP